MKMLRSSMLLFSLLILPVLASGQDRTILDSLSERLQVVPDTGKIDIFNQLSELYWQRSFDTSLLFARHALIRSEEIGDTLRIARSEKMVGNAYYYLGNYSASLEQYYASLKIFEQIGDSIEIAKLYNNLGAIHLSISEPDKGLEYFQTALGMMQRQHNLEKEAAIENNIGAIYNEKKDYEQALVYMQSSYDTRMGLGELRQAALVLNNMGEVYGNMGRYERALDYYMRSLEIADKLDDRSMLAALNANLGDVYFHLGEFKKSEEALMTGLRTAGQLHNIRIIKEVYGKLSELKRARSDFREALHYHQLYSDYQDSLLSEEKQAQIAELQMKFNAESFQRQIDQVRTENELNSQLLFRQRILIFTLILITLLILFALYINYRRNLLKKETNRLLTEKNELLNSANLQLRESAMHLMDSNATKDKFLSIIGHDLRNPLNALLGFSELIVGDALEQYSPEEIKSYNKLINEAAKNIQQLIENLLNWSRSQSGKLEFKPREIRLKDLTKEIRQIHQIHASRKAITIEDSVAENAVVFADRDLLATILRNLLNNAIKFTPEKGRILMKAEREQDHIRISVEDNGIGMSRDQIDQIFTMDGQGSTDGTSNEKGIGLGLVLCRDFVKMHHGELKVESRKGKGSKFYFTLPIKPDHRNE